MTLDLDAVNAMDRATFVSNVGPTFERAPWIAHAAWTARPFASPAALHHALFDVVERAPRDTQVAFLCGHPDLAGKEAGDGTMTRESVGEQASGGFDTLTSHEQAEVTRLNIAYRTRHGFPFVIAVRRHTKDVILSEMRRRLSGDTDSECSAALKQIAWITRDRIAALFDETRPMPSDHEAA